MRNKSFSFSLEGWCTKLYPSNKNKQINTYKYFLTNMGYKPESYIISYNEDKKEIEGVQFIDDIKSSPTQIDVVLDIDKILNYGVWK